MRILLTNDDGIYAPGISAMYAELIKLGRVEVAAPAANQSGVGHSITYLTPLIVQEAFKNDKHYGWEIAGSPADCVKLAMLELCEEPPDLIVSGINGGLNAGINVLYSGTVAAAIEGAFFRIPSIAVSLEEDPHADFEAAGSIAVQLIRRSLDYQSFSAELYNINISTQATRDYRAGKMPCIHTVPMGVERYGDHYVKRQDPKGRNYYWSTNDPPPKPTEHETDLMALASGGVTVTPLQFDMTKRSQLETMKDWNLSLGSEGT